MPIKTFQYRLYPTATQEVKLQHMLDVCRAWYNMCLNERICAYQLEKRTVSKFEQMANIKFYRVTIPAARDVPVVLLRGATTTLDEAYHAFFRRVKKGSGAVGFPKYRSYKRDNTLVFNGMRSFKAELNRVYIQNVGRLRVRYHRPMQGIIKTARVTRKAGKWYVSFACEIPEFAPLNKTGRCIGLDFGISALITDSDGNKIDNPKWYREGQAKLRVLRRKLARAQKGSNNRKKCVLAVQRQHEKVKRQREDFIDNLVHRLTLDYDLVAIEDLQISNMVHNPHLSKSILDAGWGYFGIRLQQKAKETGCVVIAVDPRYTSKTCSNCGAIFETLTLADRWVTCDCGLSLDRDHNAALNVLKRAVQVREA